MKAVSAPNAPPAAGPYSMAIKSGGFVFTSGQIGLDAKGSFVPGGIAEQTEQAIANIKAVLSAAGTDIIRVVKTTVFLADMGDFAAMNEVYAKHFTSKPARSTVQVAKLPKGALVEIETVAEQ
jgi:2-iminobutanoate/2-iminopropanoate deaminase